MQRALEDGRGRETSSDFPKSTEHYEVEKLTFQMKSVDHSREFSFCLLTNIRLIRITLPPPVVLNGIQTLQKFGFFLEIIFSPTIMI